MYREGRGKARKNKIIKKIRKKRGGLGLFLLRGFSLKLTNSIWLEVA